MTGGRVAQSDIDAARTFLATHGDIARTPDDFRRALIEVAEFRKFAPGDDITQVAATDGRICALVRGVAAFTTALGPADNRLNHILHPGDWFGAVQLFTAEPRNGSITARSECVAAMISRAALDRMFALHPGWWQHIGQLAARYGNVATNIAADLMIADSNRRCLATLLRLAGCRFETPTQYPTVAPVNQDELGAVANLSRNTVSAILRTAQQCGLVTLGYHRITVDQPDALRSIVDDF